MKRLSLSLCAEYLVAGYLLSRGWQVLKQGYRVIGSEIDLVVQKNNTLVFVEVKLRKQELKYDYTWSEICNSRKKKALVRGASSYLSTVPGLIYDEMRFDLAMVYYKSAGFQQGNKEQIAMQFYPSFFSF